MSHSWLSFYQPRSTEQIILFCLPFSGGGASTFWKWTREAIAALGICPVQLPGRENLLAQPAYSHLDELLPALAANLMPYLHHPYALFGHSMGALIIFELTRWLRRWQQPLPIHLFVSAFRSPELPSRLRPLHALPDREFIAELRHYGGTPEAVLQHAELLNVLLPALRADFTLHETFAFQAEMPLSCPISGFYGLLDPWVTSAEMEGWQAHTSSQFKLRGIPGGHFFLRESQPLLLRAIAEDLNLTVA